MPYRLPDTVPFIVAFLYSCDMRPIVPWLDRSAQVAT